MGAVFLAEDTKLGRRVALKVLPEAVASYPDRLARFAREAKAVAALNHPHIVTIHSVEEAGGVRFLTMELVEGASLDHGIPQGGLPLTRVFDIGIALADALAAAHEKGIIHRDLKPANVMVTKEGRVKVLDFGLAKLAPPPEGRAPDEPGDSAASTHLDPQSRPLTDAGGVVGTVPYMSPEQVGGETVDGRSDIFSLGVMLYEMATGRRPFGGKNNAQTISSILRDAPSPVSDARQDAPRHLVRIIDHCLRKDPEERFQTAKDVRNELRDLRREVESGASQAGDRPVSTLGSAVPGTGALSRRPGMGLWMGLAGALAVILVVVFTLNRGRQEPAGTAPATPPDNAASASPTADAKSIAVLPFEDMSQARDQEYFSDGISEELLNLLSKVPQLKVAARTSSFSFKGKGIEIPEIARQLHVAHVLEGSVRKSGDKVRITAQLIHAADGFHMWSQTWDRRLDDIFTVQDEIAADVVKQLKVKLLGEAPKTRETDSRAYALYLQGRQTGRQYTAEAFEKSDSLLHQVLEIDPHYAPAWYGLASNAVNKANIGSMRAADAYAKSREAATKALESDPAFAPAHSALGWVAMNAEKDFAGAARHMERALALDPTDLRVLSNSAVLLNILGRADEALALLKTITSRDPLNVTPLYNRGLLQLNAGRPDEAIATIRAVLALSPNRGSAHATLGLSLLASGDPPGALAEIEQETIEIERAANLPIVYHALGRKAESDAALDALIARPGQDDALGIASVYAYRGEADKAFEWLDKAARSNEYGMAETVTQYFFDGIHKDPRWLPFLRKIGCAPEQLAKIQFKVTLPD